MELENLRDNKGDVVVDLSEDLSQPVRPVGQETGEDSSALNAHAHAHAHGGHGHAHGSAISREEMIRNFKLGQKKNLWLKINGCIKPVENPFTLGKPVLFNVAKCEKTKSENYPNNDDFVQFINKLDDHGMSEVHYSAWFGNTEVLTWLVRNGGYLDQPTNTGDSLYHLAIYNGGFPTTQLLVDLGAPTNILNNKGLAPVHLASRLSRLLDVSILLDSPHFDIDSTDIDGNTALHWGIMEADYFMIQFLLRYPFDMKKKNKHGLAPLHIAARFREPEVIYALMAKDDTTVLDASGEGRLASDYAVDAEKGAIIPLLKNTENSVSFFPAIVRRNPFVHSVFVYILIFEALFYYLNWWQFLLSVAAIMTLLCVSGLGRIAKNLLYPIWLAVSILIAITWWAVVIPALYTEYPYHFLIGCIGWPSLWYCTHKLVMVIPGIPKRGKTDACEVGQIVLQINRTGEYIAEKADRFCPSCVAEKPARSKHCTHCDRCAEDFDHHCPWVNACIGKGNHHYFVIYVLVVSLCTPVVIHLFAVYLYSVFPSGFDYETATKLSLIWTAYETNSFVFSLIVIQGLFWPMICMNLFSQFYGILVGKTLNELMTGRHQQRFSIKAACKNLVSFCANCNKFPHG